MTAKTPQELPRISGTMPSGSKATIEFDDPDAGLKVLTRLQAAAGGPPKFEPGLEALKATQARQVYLAAHPEKVEEEKAIATTWSKKAIAKRKSDEEEAQ